MPHKRDKRIDLYQVCLSFFRLFEEKTEKIEKKLRKVVCNSKKRRTFAPF
jgi:hypothetical protein